MADSSRMPHATLGPEPSSELDDFFRLWARTDSGTASYWHTGFMYALTEGRKLVPLVRYSGLFRVFVEPREGAYRTTVSDAVMFSDATGSSDAPLATLRNPVTGRTVRCQHFFEGPFTLESTASAERVLINGGPEVVIPFRPRRWHRFGSQVVVSRDIYGLANPGATPTPAAGATVQPLTLATFSGSLAELRQSRSTSVANAILSQQFVGPWMPWLDMSQHAGAAVSCGAGQKLKSDLSDLPRRSRGQLARLHPAILRSVEHWKDSNR